ncbi:hypothetical protein IIA79_08070, partial [bacterium]|nr:hypothetical protein [bacterium]
EQKNLLVIAPQRWIADRLWPALSPWAARLHRYRADSGPSVAAHILRQLEDAPGQAVVGGPGAWKLAYYGRFDRVLLLDPSHPQYSPERYPQLDPRLALLLAISHRKGCTLDLIEMGLSAWDGMGNLMQVALMNAHEPSTGPPSPGQRVDTDPLPLELRQPGRRRLVYFNRLGHGRGIRCEECRVPVGCPECASLGIYFSSAANEYRCPSCSYRGKELRCPRCGLAALSAQQSGLEAVTRRKGDLIVHGSRAARKPHPEHTSVLGTSQLLEPLADFWPQEIVYVHADTRLGLMADWPRALDQAARLNSLYDNPELEYVYIVSSRLREQLGDSLTAAQIEEQWKLEMKLRRLACLPPYCCLYKLSARAPSLAAMEAARGAIGETLTAHPGTSLLRLGRAYREGGSYRLGGYLINDGLSAAALQELRWEVNKVPAPGSARDKVSADPLRAAAREKVALSVQAIRGPWL